MRGLMLIGATLVAGCNAVVGVEEVSLSPPDAGAAMGSASCGVAAEFGLVVSNPATSRLDHRMADGGPSLLFLLNTDTRPDALGVLLYDNMGGHDKLIAPGTYSLTAADSRVETCGICLGIFVDFDRATTTFAQTYQARGQGTLTVTKADAQQLAGRIQGLTFRHVDTTGSTTREIDDGCTVRVADVQFDLSYAQ
jgi:hypothetical protein